LNWHKKGSGKNQSMQEWATGDHTVRKARSREQGKGTNPLSFQQCDTATLASLTVEPPAEDLLPSNNSSADPSMKCNPVLPSRIHIPPVSSPKHRTYELTI